jgi:ferredoxin
MDADARAAYNAQLESALADEEDGYSGEPISKWMPAVNPKMSKNEDPAEARAVFVDENTCIGCKQCGGSAAGGWGGGGGGAAARAVTPGFACLGLVVCSRPAPALPPRGQRVAGFCLTPPSFPSPNNAPAP